MRIKNLMVSGLLVALITSPFVVNTASAAEQIYQMGLTYRTGPYAPNGVPFANGFADYLTLLNERDGWILVMDFGSPLVAYRLCTKSVRWATTPRWLSSATRN